MNETKGEILRRGEKEEEINEVERLLDWTFSRELMWSVLILTCFIGLIELLPEIKQYGSSINDVCLTSLVVFVALALVGGCIFAIDKFARLAYAEGVLLRKLSKTTRQALFSTMGPSRIFFRRDKKGNLLGLKRWVVSLVSFIFAVIWIAIIILKVI